MQDTDHHPLPDAKQYCPTLALRKANEEGALLVDVRERDEIEARALDVAGVINIPMSEFERRHAELPRDRLLVLVCAVGERSLKATYLLMYRGYTQVANLEGGLAQWVRKGFPVKGDSTAVAAGGCACAKAIPAAGSGCC